MRDLKEGLMNSLNIRKKNGLKEFPWLSVIVMAMIMLGCLAWPVLSGSDPARMYLDQLNLAPGSGHIFGTDTLGRDIWSLIWYGGLRSLIIGVLATVISTFIAVVYGTISGMAGETVDGIMMRFTEILLSIPSILLIVFMQAAIGQRNVIGITLIIGITGWMNISKMAR